MTPLVTCITPTYNRRPFLPRAIDYFLRQDYPSREMIILDDGEDDVADLVPRHASIRYSRLPRRLSTGAKRNLACEEAKGDVILHWDDDDWMAQDRISRQVRGLLDSQADLTGLDRIYYFHPERGSAFEYSYPPGQRPWLAGNSLCYPKDFWAGNRFPSLTVGEDSRFVWSGKSKKMVALQAPEIMVGIIHAENASPKQVRGKRWLPLATETLRGLMGADFSAYEPGPARAAAAGSHAIGGVVPVAIPSGGSNRQAFLPGPRAQRTRILAAGGTGIGDALRMTPFLRALVELGHDVEALLFLDQPEAAHLLQDMPGVSAYHVVPRVSPHGGGRAPHPGMSAISNRDYGIAAFGALTLGMRRWVRAQKKLAFDGQEWTRRGDTWCWGKLAAQLGWQGPLPAPYARPSGRDFGLRSGTVALHPGCKADWPWKRWHGFPDLARELLKVGHAQVLLVGAEGDRKGPGTYFRSLGAWPPEAEDWIGKLSLVDTAALLSQCSALVAGDSGIMHLGAALGIPTLGLFGLTSPDREAMRLPNMHTFTKGLPCEAACRLEPWGRRDCDHHLRCLRTLEPREVADKVRAIVPPAAPGAATGLIRPDPFPAAPSSAPADNPSPAGVERPSKPRDGLKLTYYGNAFDATGYGQAARAYIHAFHAAGITLSVVDTGSQPRQVRDPLTESLLDRPQEPDFHLFHGIPTHWGQRAFRLPNAIGMTVWETDTMPSQWRNALNHVREVWLPCDFNIQTFRRYLDKPLFKLPHACFSAAGEADAGIREALAGCPEIVPEDFVFYSIFAWQERKSPKETMEAFLKALPDEPRAVLLLKTGPEAAGQAREALEEIRNRVPSKARILIRCESWSEEQLRALHRRGDCYVSLHRGEGWGYPLFEAALLGKPTIATGYSGPLEYLKADSHHLIRYTQAPVRQAYTYYHSRMRWAQPDITHAADAMSWVFQHPGEAKQRAALAATALGREYSLESIGALARDRLMALLSRTHPERWRTLDRNWNRQRYEPPTPIPGSWYDAAYFEEGAKSNWIGGYSWPGFQGLFRETADFLAECFPSASTFLDAGCAKGFLVRALREKGKECIGFDHSEWAIEAAEPSMRPYLHKAGVDDAAFERIFDIVLALDILECLTEEQAISFLGKARAWTRQAIFAIIPLERSSDQAGTDRDLSHITMKPRVWWHELFLRSGWRQDPLHKVAEHLCQAHSLPRRMDWQLFIYAPQNESPIH